MDPLPVLYEPQKVASCFEVRYKVPFECYSNKKNGDLQTLSIEILDPRPNAGVNRYSCLAILEDGGRASENHASSIDEVLA
jgi:hypothetical protein